MLFDIKETFFQCPETFSGLADQPGTGAVAAIGGAEGRGQEQDFVGIGVDQVRGGAVILLAQRVGQLTRADQSFAIARNDRSAQGLGFQQSGIMRCERKGERDIAFKRSALGVAQLDVFLQLFEAGDPVGDLPFPIFFGHKNLISTQ